MPDIFADTNYWVAKIYPADQWHERVIDIEFELGIFNLVTTETVLVETLNYFSEYRPDVKDIAARAVESILESPEVVVISQTSSVFQAGIALYKSRLDKGYSLTDCISMNICRDRNISDVLTHDDHFRQEGFVVLF